MRHRDKAILLYADSETDADILYAAKIFIPDPFAYVRIGRKSFMVVSDLEYSRARDQAQVDHVLSQNDLMKKLPATASGPATIADALAYVLRHKGVRRIQVPRTFPLGLADELRKGGLLVECAKEPFFPERALKDERDVAHIREALSAAEHGMRAAMNVLREARILKNRRNALSHGGRLLTAERLKAIIQRAVIEKDCLARHTIVSCGPQSYNPHEEGRGTLYAHQPLIIDIFPRSNRTGYYGDITRTVVKGEPPEWVVRAYTAVRQAQAIAISSIRPGARGNRIHEKILRFFEQSGFPTKKLGDTMIGFFHGTGHGLGLALHEYPWISQRPCTLKAGHVVTVEPGLYCPDRGGVRLEDVVWVTEQGPEVLTRFPKVLKV